jgi:hypothetical protein
MNRFLNSISQIGVAVFLFALLTSCSGTRKAVREPIKEQGDEFLIRKLKEHELKFDQFSAKFNVAYEVDRKKTTVNGNLRIEHDSLIWISITPALGIEAVRFMLTPDSIKFINRLSNTYFISDFSYINQLLNKTLDFDMAQAFLLGNDFSLYESNSFKASVEGQQYKLNTVNRRKIRRYVRRNDEDISIPIQSIWLDPENFKVSKVILKEAERDSRKFQANYSEFEKIMEELIPTILEFKVETDDKKIIINIRYSKIQLNQNQSYPFHIPESYTETKEIQSKK